MSPALEGRVSAGAQESTEGSVNSLYSQVLSQLRSDILSGRFAPGQRLVQEQLAERYGVSRLPVRDAIQQLSSEGLVAIRPRSGAWIQRPIYEDFVSQYLVRERVEPLALSLSLPEMGLEHHRRIQELHAGLVRDFENLPTGDDVSAFLDADHRFHMEFYSTLPYPTIHRIMTRLWNTTHRYRHLFMSTLDASAWSAVKLDHAAIVDAMLRSDIVSASALLEMHLRRTRLQLADYQDLFA